MSTLVLVESPAKAKTISKYLGTGFTVKATVGHIRDLPKSNKKAIDIEGGFVPHYEIVKGKEKIVDEIRRLAKKADSVLLATDPDREGEAIAWHVAEAAELNHPKRVVFHEITKTAVQDAVAHPREVDQNLRKAQEARRVLDRLVGYDLSGLIWKKLRYGLSAGRVQSPALRIVVEREREIQAFVPEDFWVITGAFATVNGSKMLLICSEEPRTQAETDRILEQARASEWKISEVKETKTQRNPNPPFTTSTLQQSASSRLGYSPSRTMKLAQGLYEKGLITYMRTDSTTLSKEAIAHMGSYIMKTFGTSYADAKNFQTKSKVAQEAHEAIRPTSATVTSGGANPDEQKLYGLIWRRALASQMKPADILRTKISASVVGNSIPSFAVTGSRTLFDGWLALDKAAAGDDLELPAVSAGDHIELREIWEEHKQTEPPKRYTEAGLIKELEKRGIGRPSTYAAIMHTLGERKYVEKEGRSLKPTETGEAVSAFLENHFATIISDSFTAEMEEELDDVANGTLSYANLLSEFYGPFMKQVASKADIPRINDFGDAPKEFTCPICTGAMKYKLGRNGMFMSCARFPDCSGARTRTGEIMKAPEETGEDCPECLEGKLVLRAGRFGTFIACSRYPKCKYVKQDEAEAAKKDTGIQCPVCKEGTMVERAGRFGIFYSCSRYPTCSNAIKARPTGDLCQLCGSLMMEGTKTIPTRCSNKTCENHNPHKKLRAS